LRKLRYRINIHGEHCILLKGFNNTEDKKQAKMNRNDHINFEQETHLK